MRLWVKIGLFLSSYLPLFLILAIKNWFNFYMVFLFVAITTFCCLVWIGVIWITKKGTAESYRVLSYENKAKESLNYLIPYIISFVSFNLDRWQDWTALAILLSILFVIYLNSDLLYINPMLLLFHYKIYRVEVYKPLIGSQEKSIEIFLITKRNRLKRDESISIKEIEKNVALEVPE